LFLHFLSRDKKTKQKKTPVPRLTLRVVATAGAHGNSPALRRAQTVRALIPVRCVDARRETKGLKKHNVKTVFKPSFEGTNCGLPPRERSLTKLAFGSARHLIGRRLDPEKDTVKCRNKVERKHTADAQAEEHNACHAAKEGVMIDDQRREPQHGG